MIIQLGYVCFLLCADVRDVLYNMSVCLSKILGKSLEQGGSGSQICGTTPALCSAPLIPNRLTTEEC